LIALLKINNNTTDLTKNTLNINDINVPRGHILVRSINPVNVIFYLDSDSFIRDDVSILAEKYNVSIKNPEECLALVKNVRPILNHLYSSSVLNIASLKKYTVKEMVAWITARNVVTQEKT